MSLVGTLWKSNANGDILTVTSDEGNWVGISDDDSGNTHYMNASFLRRRYKRMQPDMVNHPPHYRGNGSGIECIDVAEHMSFVLGNALKYIWRYESRGSGEQDLRKAKWYLQRALGFGHSPIPPHKARNLLYDVLQHEPSGLRHGLFSLILFGDLRKAIFAIDEELERDV
jgi:hypothetical protein